MRIWLSLQDCPAPGLSTHRTMRSNTWARLMEPTGGFQPLYSSCWCWCSWIEWATFHWIYIEWAILLNYLCLSSSGLQVVVNLAWIFNFSRCGCWTMKKQMLVTLTFVTYFWISPFFLSRMPGWRRWLTAIEGKPVVNSHFQNGKRPTQERSKLQKLSSSYPRWGSMMHIPKVNLSL